MASQGSATVPAAPAVPRGRIQIVDYYRLVAALMVVGFHYFYNGIAGGKVTSIEHSPVLVELVKYGYLGVDLFFLLSGFVIAQSAMGKSARQFVVGRVVRLYPAFWVALALTTAVALVWGGTLMSVTPAQVLANLTMMPASLGYAPVDGVYWTLAYELKFYALIAIVVLVRQAHRLVLLMPVWAIGMAMFSCVAPGLSSSVDFLGGYYLLFAAGAIMALIRSHGWTPLRAVGLVAAYVAVLPVEVARAHGIENGSVTLAIPIVIALITLFFVALLLTFSPRVASLSLPAAALAGGLTYPIYLLHAHIGYMVLDRVATPANRWIVYAALLVGLFAVAYAIHVLVERGLRTQWYRVFDATVGRVVGVVESAAAGVARGARRLWAGVRPT